jgi:nucleotide-binding universal stress UspA family protein
MKKVMIALDYDPTAQQVAETGFKLAKTLRAEVILLHVKTDLAYYTSSEVDAGLEFISMAPWKLIAGDEDLDKAAQQFLDKTKHHFGGDNIQTLVKEGDIAGAIIEAAQDMHVNIIVMGSHSRKWLENIVMGSVSEKVLKHTSVPVFIVPTKKKK